MVAGQTYDVSITMKNTGTTTWNATSGYKLGSHTPYNNIAWGLCRVELNQGESVSPGEEKTFAFKITAPTYPRTYNFQWRMIVEWVEWFGDLTPDEFTFTVPAPSLDFNANPSSIAPGPGQQATLSWSLEDSGSCTIDQSCTCLASGEWSGGKPLSGSQIVSPSDTSIYTLECTCACGSIKKSSTVYVSEITESPRIKIRSSGGVPEFYNTLTGEKFVLRGNNYIPLTYQCGSLWHSTFDQGLYNPDEIESVLEEMQLNGYNAVRVWLSYKKIGGFLTEPGLDPDYMDSVIDFLKRARNHGIYVILVNQGIPQNYDDDPWSLPPDMNYFNSYFLWQEQINRCKAELVDVVNFIKSDDPKLLSTVFSYDLWNEPRFFYGYLPFSLTTGFVTPAEGGTYDMSDPNQKELMKDNSLTYWMNDVSSAVKSADPNALTTSSLYMHFNASLLAVDRSDVDHLAIHFYPRGNANEYLENYMNLAEYDQLSGEKPLIWGEFGVHETHYPDINNAVNVLRDSMNGSCSYNLQGWFLWTWDTNNSNTWNAIEENGTINNAISPLNWPLVCIDSDFIAHYEFEASANDNSLYANHGIIHGNPIFETGKVGQGIRLDGVGDYVEVPDTPELSGGSPLVKTVEAWFKLDDVTGNRDIVGKQLDGNTKDWVLIVQNGLLKYHSESNGEDYLCSQTTGSISPGVWYHGAFVADEPNVYVYVDGELVGSCSDMNSNSIDTNSPVEIGATTYAPRYTPGIIDDVRVYSRPLTQEEIRDHFNLVADPDVDGDGDVDIDDLVAVSIDFGKKTGFDPNADTDNNGEIDVFDLVFVASRFT
ncbi:MAG: cellulase family glycosylhydrolase [Candidatus Aenigmarchaeota archaeon]|nr:cellulase family glycosylhydrolase [Candidatus Aenigmarchaeota archaeon]